MPAGNKQAHTAPRIAAVGDLCGFGRCSLAVAIAALSALGEQACPLQTAALSTHTGGFGAPARAPMAGYMAEALEHWRGLALRFDAVLTGYLATAEQAETVRALLEGQGEALRVVDPVMGDHGRMYSSLPADMPERMREICSLADVITPNLTEACLLAGREMPEEPLSTASAEELLNDVRRATGAGTVLVTGLRIVGGAANCSLGADGRLLSARFTREPGAYPGTGDLFASVLTGALARGADLAEAVELAGEFVRRAVARTNALGCDKREGVQFEAELPFLTNWAATREA